MQITANGRPPVLEAEAVGQHITTAVPLPLGRLHVLQATERSATNRTILFRVDCEGLDSSATGRLEIRTPSIEKRGVVVMMTGNHSNSVWNDWPLARHLGDRLADDGLLVVQLCWATSWLAAETGENAGPVRLACRPATVIKWVYERFYDPLEVPKDVDRAGFAIAGVSGGASQLCYSLSHYGLSDVVDLAIPISGPPHAAQHKGCQRKADDVEHWYKDDHSWIVDASYGFQPGDGPCARHDANWASRWLLESNDGSGNHFYPTTRIQMILGGADRTEAVAHALSYLNVLYRSGSPHVGLRIVPGMGHLVQSSSLGLSAFREALIANESRDDQRARDLDSSLLTTSAVRGDGH